MYRGAVIAIAMSFAAAVLIGCGGSGGTTTATPGSVTTIPGSAKCTMDDYAKIQAGATQMEQCQKTNKCYTQDGSKINFDEPCVSKCVANTGAGSSCADDYAKFEICISGKELSQPPVFCDLACQCNFCGLAKLLPSAEGNPCPSAPR